MGCFSWCLLDTKRELVMGQLFKVLIPEEFGGGYILTRYEDYGEFDHKSETYDLYEILAAWNEGGIELNEYGVVACSPETDMNRSRGIDIGCYDHEAAKLKFPLRLTSIEDEKTYEDYDGMFSIAAPSQGWDAQTVYDDKLFRTSYYGTEVYKRMWR